MEHVHALSNHSHAPPLPHVLGRLEAELAAPAPGRQSAHRLSDQVASMLASLQLYQATAVSQDGLYATIEQRMPQEAPNLRRMRVMYRLLSRRAERLLWEIRRSGDGAYDAVRWRLRQLAEQVRDHHQQETRLVFEAYLRENGALD